MILCLVYNILLIVVALSAFPLLCRYRRRKRTIAFFHPYCNSGGGGERVLWTAIKALSKRLSDTDFKFFIYTGDVDVSREEIFSKVEKCFNIPVEESQKRIELIPLTKRWLLEAKYYPRFTLAMQAFGGFLLGLEALWRCSPVIFVDTTGCPLTLPLFKLIGGCRTACYVHYPTISNDMIQLVGSAKETYNNAGRIARNRFFTACKLLYYFDFSFLYWFCGQFADVVMVNGSWTRSHIDKLWGVSPFGARFKSPSPQVVYPPCDVAHLVTIITVTEQLLANDRQVDILSVGQFRPEKDHRLQLQAFAESRKLIERENLDYKLRLVVVGGCRGEEDRQLLDGLQSYAKSLGDSVGDDIEFRINVSFDTLLELFCTSLIGIHTMWNEHFGISVVEGMAAGQMMIAHNSGGPKMDIIGSEVKSAEQNQPVLGFLATTKEEYARTIVDVLKLSGDDRARIRRNARKAAARFSNENFERGFIDALEPLLLAA